MITLLFCWIYYFLIFFSGGFLSVKLLSFLFKRKSSIPTLYIPFIGISTIIFLSEITSLFYRVNIEFHFFILGLITIGVSLSFKEWKNLLLSLFNKLRSTPTVIKVVFLYFTLFTLFISTDGCFYNNDCGTYHFQNIMWAKSYKVVPGIANLHDRFGHPSSWYLIHAFADFYFLNKASYHIFNSLLFILISGICLIDIGDLMKGKQKTRNYYSFFILIFLSVYYTSFYYSFLTSITPDLPVNIFAILCMFLLIDFNENKNVSEHSLSSILIFALFVITAFSLRIAGIYLFIPLLFLIIKYSVQVFSKNYIYKFILFCLILIIPVLLRNIILSGWILFPVTSIDIVNVDWKLPKTIADETLKGPRYFAFIDTREGDIKSLLSLLDTPYLTLLIKWLRVQLFEGGFMYWVYAVGTIFAFCIAFFKRGRIVLSNHLIVVSSSLLLFIAWILSSPLFRFGFGYVAILYSVLASCIVIILIKDANKYLTGIRIIIYCTLLFCLLKITISSTNVSLKSNVLSYPLRLLKYIGKEAPLFQLQKIPDAPYSEIKISDSQSIHVTKWDTTWGKGARNSVYIPQGCMVIDQSNKSSVEGCYAFVTMSWMAPLPATAKIYNGLTARSTDIKDGFKIIPPVIK